MAQPGVVAPWRATYVPGDWYVIAGPTSLVVLEPGPGRGDMVIDLWADVVASSSMSDLIDRLAGYGLTELPDLAVIFWSTAGMRTLVRGRVSLVDPDTGTAVATGNDVITWNEVGLGDRRRVSVRVEAAPQGEELPLAVGVVRVGALELNATEDGEVRSPQPLLRRAPVRPTLSAQSAAVGGPAGAGSVAAPEPTDETTHDQRSGEPAGQLAHPTPSPVADTQPPSTDVRREQDHQELTPTQQLPPDQAGDTVDGSAGHPAGGPGEAVPAATARPDHPASGGSSADEDTGPDFPPIEDDTDTDTASAGYVDSAWGPQPPEEAGAGLGAGAAGAEAAGAALGAAAGTAAAGTAAAGSGSAGAGGFVGGVGRGPEGWGGSAGSPQEFSTAQFEMENDDTQLFDGPIAVGPHGQQAGPGSSASTEPLVEGVRCPNGHANAPGSAFCRICRHPIQPGPPELMPLPLLARLRAADGTVIDLDRAVLLGRAPSEERGTASLPRLVTLASPAQDISRTHLQVVPDNWQVVVTDLHSTNGTFVTDPGPSGNKGMLPPGQPIPVPIGATLELGEGVTITVEPGD